MSQEAYERLGNASNAIRTAREACAGDYVGLDLEDLKLLSAMEDRCNKLQRQVDNHDNPSVKENA